MFNFFRRKSVVKPTFQNFEQMPSLTVAIVGYKEDYSAILTSLQGSLRIRNYFRTYIEKKLFPHDDPCLVYFNQNKDAKDSLSKKVMSILLSNTNMSRDRLSVLRGLVDKTNWLSLIVLTEEERNFVFNKLSDEEREYLLYDKYYEERVNEKLEIMLKYDGLLYMEENDENRQKITNLGREYESFNFYLLCTQPSKIWYEYEWEEIIAPREEPLSHFLGITVPSGETVLGQLVKMYPQRWTNFIYGYLDQYDKTESATHTALHRKYSLIMNLLENEKKILEKAAFPDQAQAERILSHIRFEIRNAVKDKIKNWVNRILIPSIDKFLLFGQSKWDSFVEILPIVKSEIILLLDVGIDIGEQAERVLNVLCEFRPNIGMVLCRGPYIFLNSEYLKRYIVEEMSMDIQNIGKFSAAGVHFSRALSSYGINIKKVDYI